MTLASLKCCADWTYSLLNLENPKLTLLVVRIARVRQRLQVMVRPSRLATSMFELSTPLATHRIVFATLWKIALARQSSREIHSLLAVRMMPDFSNLLVTDGMNLLRWAGCGRFFEGTPEQMHEALNVRLAGLPDDTVVYVRGYWPLLTLNPPNTMNSLAMSIQNQTSDSLYPCPKRPILRSWRVLPRTIK